MAKENWGALTENARSRLLDQYISRVLAATNSRDVETVKNKTYDLMKSEGVFDKCLGWKNKGADGFYSYFAHKWVAPQIVYRVSKYVKDVSAIGSGAIPWSTEDNAAEDNEEISGLSPKTNYIKYIFICVGVLVLVLIIRKIKQNGK